MKDTGQKFTDKATDWLITFGPRIILAIVAFFAGLWVTRFLSREGKRRMDIDLSFPSTMDVDHVRGIIQETIGNMNTLPKDRQPGLVSIRWIKTVLPYRSTYGPMRMV